MANLHWNVQPYRFLGEMRANYTTAVFLTMRKGAETIAPQIQEWMRENAPWTDRTPAERALWEGFVKGKRKEQIGNYGEKHGKLTAKNARQSLRAYVEIDEREYESFRKGVKVAKRQDARTLKQMNVGRKVTLLSVPRKQSAVTAFKKEFAKQQIPFVQIRLNYSSDEPLYAIWLEVANQGRFSIIGRTLEIWGQKYFNTVKSRLNLVQYRKYTLTDALSPEEQFAQYAAERTAMNRETGRPDYEPWSPTKAAERRRRQPEYDSEKAKANRRRSQQELLNRPSADRLYTEKTHSGPTFDLFRTVRR